MQDLKQHQIIKEPSKFSWITSIVLLSLTLISIGGIYGYGFIQKSTIEELQANIAQLDSDIQLASTDKDIIIANILSSTNIRPSIDLKALVSAFRLAAGQAGVRLQGFSVKDDILTSTLIATQEQAGIDPVETVIAMMRNKNTNTGLQLDPIYALSGSPTERTTGVSFRILPSKSITNAQ